MFNGYRVSALGAEIILRWLVVIVTQHHIVNVFNAAEVCT